MRAARHEAARVQYADGIYRNPWENDQEQVREIGVSFKRRRTAHTTGLKERALLDENGLSSSDAGTTKKGTAKSKPRVKAGAKARVKKQPP